MKFTKEVRIMLKINKADIGNAFGPWKQIGPSFSVIVDAKQRHRYAVCKCKTGHVRLNRVNAMRRGDILCQECERVTWLYGINRQTEYAIWRGMIDRCHNPTCTAYHYYGGRGITVCNEWRKSFKAFFDYVGARPGAGYDLDRFPDNNGGYRPGNIRWATRKENCRNTRQNRIVEYRGRAITVAELAENTRIPRHVLYGRLDLGWSVEDAISRPVRGMSGKNRLDVARFPS